MKEAVKQKFDLAVIGAGPGGYVAAIQGAQMGKKVALIEKGELGGTCLNVGCIPSKALLSSAGLLHKLKEAEAFGIHVEGISFDYRKVQERKKEIVSRIRQSLTGLLKAHGVTVFKGSAHFESPKDLKVKGVDSTWIHSDAIIIATGSEPMDLPSFPCDHRDILNSTSALDLEELPKTLAIIGGGYIGCEFASLFAEFGVKITLIEALPAILQVQGKTLSEALTTAFTKRGIEIRTKTAVRKIERHAQGLILDFQQGGPLHVEKAIICVGRRWNLVERLCLEKAGLKPLPNGVIEVNQKMETEVSGIYAIGDITGLSMLAHVASHQGIVAAKNACGQDTRLYYNAIPAVIFTHPEIAMVGLTAEKATKKGLQIEVGRFPFGALGKSIASSATEGFAEVISDQKTGEIYGAQVVGEGASVMIGEMALAIQNELTLECIIDTIHPHPTLSEAWLEAALLAKNTPIHFPPKKSK